MVEADESDRSLLELAPGDRRAHERRARPPHDLRLAARRRRDVPRVPRRSRERAAVIWDRPGAARARARGPRRRAVRRRARADRRRLALRARRRRRSSWRCRAPTTRRNAAAALTAARLAGADLAQAAGRAARLPGRRPALRAARRAPPRAREVVDDYAHHPTEVAATLEAARTLAPRRVIAVFQPHLFSRTARQARGVRRRARARRRGRRARRLPGARAGRRTSPA